MTCLLLFNVSGEVKSDVGGFTESVRMLGEHIRLILVDDGKGRGRPDTIEFLDGEGIVVKTESVFPENTYRPGRVRTFLSPNGEYLGVFTMYSVDRGKGEGERNGRFVLYDVRGERLWEEEASDPEEIERLNKRRCYPRDDGSICLFFTVEEKWEHVDRTGAEVGSVLLEPWREENERIDWQEFWGPEMRYAALLRTSREGLRYELSYLDVEAGKVLWSSRTEGLTARVAGLFTEMGVILIEETSSKDDRRYVHAYELAGSSIWRREVRRAFEASVDAGRPGALRLDYFEVDTASFGDKGGEWKKRTGSELVEALTGEVVETSDQ